MELDYPRLPGMYTQGIAGNMHDYQKIAQLTEKKVNNRQAVDFLQIFGNLAAAFR